MNVGEGQVAGSAEAAITNPPSGAIAAVVWFWVVRLGICETDPAHGTLAARANEIASKATAGVTETARNNRVKTPQAL